MNLLAELKWRGLIYDIVGEEELEKRLAEKPITLYCGFDPTADSLHIGSLLMIVTMLRFLKAGHRVIALTGGGTGLIGDPSGKKTARRLNSPETVSEWAEAFKKQLGKFIDFDEVRAFSRDNSAWLCSMSAIEMWRDYGKHFSVNYMLAKESVRSRLETGLTYLEFSYMVMQAIDYLKMYNDPLLNCELQIGGQDQWGNITAGIELIRRVCGSDAKAYGLTIPLVTKEDGTKYGKTETGTVWLDENRTSPYEMYQFLINTSDADVIRFLKYYTFLDPDEIVEIEKRFSEHPEQREAQKILAREIVTLVHGEEAYKEAVKISKAFFGGCFGELNTKQIDMAFKDFPRFETEKDLGLIDALVSIKAAVSKREARTFVKGGGISINGNVVKEEEYIVTKEKALGNKYTVIRRGKKNYYLIKHL